MYELGPPLDGVTVDPGTSLLLSGPPLAGKAELGYDLLANGVEHGDAVIIVSNNDSDQRLRSDYEELFDADVPVGIVDCITKQ